MIELDQDCWARFCVEPDEENFTALYESVKRLVYTLCYRILWNEEDASDAVP